MIAYIRIPRFYVRVLGMEHSEEPVVVTKGKRVLDLNLAAEKRRLNTEMTNRDAKASLMGGVFKEWEAATYVEPQVKWLDSCCQFSDLIEPDEQHAAWVDLSMHPDQIATFFGLREAIVDSVGGLAKSKWLSKLACKHGDIALEAVYDPLSFLNAIHLDQIKVIDPQEVARLEFLGYRDCRSAQDISREVLTRQFGERALMIWNAVRGLHLDFVEPAYPEKSLSERYYFPSPVDDLSAVDSVLLKISDRIASRLIAGDWFGANLQLIVEFNDEVLHASERTFVKPLHDRRSVYFAAKRLWEEVSTEASVASLRLRITELRKKRQHQQTFEQLAQREKVQRAETALSSVRKVFGDVSVQLASDIKLPRRERVLREWRNATGWN